MLGTRTQMEHGENLGARIDRQPQPEHLSRGAEPGANFVQLQVWEMQVTEAAHVQGLGMFPCASEPGGDGGLTVALRPAPRRKGRVLQPGRTARLRSAEKGF